MPLTKKGEEIMESMKETYGDPDKAEQVFYASKNKGAISGVDAILGLHGGISGGLVPINGPSGGALSGVDSICGHQHK